MALKIALCFSGQMRTLDRCIASIRRHLLEPFEPDVFVHAAADADADKALLLDPRILEVETQPWFDEKLYARRVARGCVGIQSVLRQLWSLQKANDLKRKYEASRGFRYDFTMRVRPDTEFVQGPIELEEIPPARRGVWIPKFSNWFGLNDRFAFGTDEEMDLYSLRFDELDAYIARGGLFHPETFLWWHLVQKRVEVHRTNAAFYTLRANGERVLPEFYAEYKDFTLKVPPPQSDCLDRTGFPEMPILGNLTTTRVGA